MQRATQAAVADADTVPTVHEAFYATAATVAPIVMLGLAYLDRRRSVTAAPRKRARMAWANTLPAALAVWISLCVLGGFVRDTQTWRWAVLGLLSLDVLTGMYGMAQQAMEPSDPPRS